MKSFFSIQSRNLWLLIYLFLLGFAFWTWFERVNSDSGYYLFHAINKKWFYTEHQRYVLAIAELPALLAAWIHLPLKWVIIAYSAGHVFLFLAVSAISWRLTRKPVFALISSLCAFLGLRESLYTPQFELYYGIQFLILTYAVYRSSLKPFVKSTLLFITLFFTFTAHPFALGCTVFLFISHQVFRKQFLLRDSLILLLLLAVYIIWKKAVASGYESGKIQMFSEAFLSRKYLGVFSFSLLKTGIRSLLFHYPDVLLIFITGMVGYIRRKQWGLLLTHTGSVLLFLLFIWTIYPPEKSLSRYAEQVYFPLIFLAVSFLFFIEIKEELKSYAAFYPAVILRILLIFSAYPVFRERTVLMDRLISETADKTGRRFYTDIKKMGQRQYDLADWSYGFETLMRSSASGKKCVTITKDEDYFFQNNDSLLKKDEYLFRMWEIEKTGSLNPEYFRLDTGLYQKL